MLAVVLLKAYTSSVEQSEHVYSAVIRCSSPELQLLLTRHLPKTPLLFRRTSTTILTYRDPRIPEQPYCLLRGHDFLLRLQRPPAMLLHLLFLHLAPPEGGHGQVCSIREVSVNSCQVSTIRFRHHLTHCQAKSLFPFLSAKLSSAYQTLICRGTCAEETRHRLYHPYPSPGLKRRWLRH